MLADDIHNLEDAIEDIPTIVPAVPLKVAKQGSSLKKNESKKKKASLKVNFSIEEEA